jgi:DeoR/GlpR family transcriptional regulator of sugar metabolism
MLAAERQELLLERLQRDGRIVAGNMAVELGISEDSIRRDLRELAAAGLCQRVYGGALPASPAISNYSTRQSINLESKRRVAKVAAGLVVPGSVAIIDGGTTTLAMVAEIPRSLEATVITHSPTIAVALLEHVGIEVLLIGGRMFKHSAVTCGAIAMEAVQQIHADLFFVGVTGVHPEAGLTTGDWDEATMKRALSRRAADTYVLASTEKMGAASEFSVLPLGEVAGIITDAPPTHHVTKQLQELGSRIIFG